MHPSASLTNVGAQAYAGTQKFLIYGYGGGSSTSSSRRLKKRNYPTSQDTAPFEVKMTRRGGFSTIADIMVGTIFTEKCVIVVNCEL